MQLSRGAVHVWYFDASALVKLVVDEGDHAPVRNFYHSHTNCHANSLCIMEGILGG